MAPQACCALFPILLVPYFKKVGFNFYQNIFQIFVYDLSFSCDLRHSNLWDRISSHPFFMGTVVMQQHNMLYVIVYN